MDKKSKILVIVFIALVLMSVAFTFYKTVILQDFEVIDSAEEEDSNAKIDENQSEEGESENISVESDIELEQTEE